jgi:MtrB/PioB family decaheme-associated outer membrane protein
MRVSTQHQALRPSVAAVRAAVLAMSLTAPLATMAQDAAVDALAVPRSSIEVGVGTTDKASAKAHEYDGLKRSGAYFIGDFDLRGGGRYDSSDANRWRIWGRDLGTDNRALGAEQSLQGIARFGMSYEEFQRNRSDSYQTPLLGAGTNRLTLPSNWIVPVVPRVSGTAINARGLSTDVTASNALVSGVSTAPTAAQLTQAAAMQAADLPAFHNFTVGTKRTRLEFNAQVNLGPRWDVTANVRNEDRIGTQLMGTVTRFTGGDIATIIPDLIDQNHQQVTLGLNYTGQDLVVQTHYHLSALTNNVSSMTWGNWATAGSNSNLQTMGSAPSNALHQLGFNGSYRFTSSTRLAASLSYGRNTQNDSFLTDSGTVLVPVASLNGLVINKAASLKLTSRPITGLTLSAAAKLDERDNKTPVNIYGYYDAGEARGGGASVFTAAFPTANLANNTNLNANRAYSRKLTQGNLDANYSFSPGQVLRAGFEKAKTERWCNGSWIACVDANTANENTVRGEYQFTAVDTLTGRLGVTHSSRSVDYNENAFLALVPMANVSPTGAPVVNGVGSTAYSTLLALGVNGYGPVSGLNPLPATGSAAAFFFANNNALSNALYGNQNRISELPGMRRYNMADRTRDKLRSSLSWQANDTLSLQASFDMNRDNYAHSVYGLQNAKGYSTSLDASYAASEDFSVGLYATFEAQKSRSAGNTYTANSTATSVSGFTAISGGCYATIALRNASNKVDACLDWTADNRDRVSTFGLALTRKNLAGGKLDVNGGLTVSDARTSNTNTGGNYANNPLAVAGAPVGTVAAYYIAATPFPDVTTRTTELRLGVKWRLDDARALRVGYLYQTMRSSDWAYDGLQFGGLAGVLPTLEQAPRYTVQTVGLSFIYSFR